MRLALAAAAVLLAAGPACADPVVVTLRERATARAPVVTLFDVADLSGGPAEALAAIAALDVAEIKGRDAAATVTRAAVEFRLKLAGRDGVTVAGAARTSVTLPRRTVTAEEIVTAARAELARRLPPDAGAIELAQPVVAALPEVAVGEAVAVAAQPHGPVAAGRVQMDAVVSAGGRRLLALPVVFTVGGAGRAAPLAPLAPVGRAGERVTMVVRAGGLSVTAAGEAQQAGAVGQTIRVMNADSRKVVSARVSGPGTVDVELGGAP